RAGRSAAVPPHHVRGQHRVAAVFHGGRGIAGGGGRAYAATPRHSPYRAQHRVQRGVHYRPRTPAPARDRGGRRRHHGGGPHHERRGRLPVVFGTAAGGVASRHELATRLERDPGAVPLRPPHRRPGDRHERRGRAAAALHRVVAAERAGPGRLCGELQRAVLVHHVDVGGADGRRGDRRGPE